MLRRFGNAIRHASEQCCLARGTRFPRAERLLNVLPYGESWAVALEAVTWRSFLPAYDDGPSFGEA